MSLIQAPSTPRRVEVARATPCLMASSKPVSEAALSSVTLATDICTPLPWLALCFPEHLLPAPAESKRSATRATMPETSQRADVLTSRRRQHDNQRGMQEVSALPASRLQFGQQYGVARRLLRAPGRLDGHRYRVGLRYGVRDRGRRHVTVGLEEAAGFGHVVAYNPDLTRPVLGHRRHVIGHQDDLILADGGHFGVGALIRPRSPKGDRLALLYLPPFLGVLDLGLQVLYLALRVLNPALQVLYLTLQEHVPRKQPDHEQDRSAEREAPDAEIIPDPCECRLAPGAAGLGLGLHHLHHPTAELRRWFLFLRGESEQAHHGAELVYLRLPLRVGGQVILEALPLFLGQGAEYVGVFEVFEAFVVHLAHLGTAASLDSKKSLIFFSPNRILPLTVPRGRLRSSDISTCVYPET